MPRRKDKTPGADQVRDRVMKACRFIIAKRLRGVTSNADLCKELGIAEARVREWEKGTGNPTGDTLWLLCELFGISGSWLLQEKGPMIPGDPDMDVLAAMRRLVNQVERRRPATRRKAQ